MCVSLLWFFFFFFLTDLYNQIHYLGKEKRYIIIYKLKLPFFIIATFLDTTYGATKMYLFMSSNITNFLFEGWNSTNPLGLFIMCLVAVMSAIAYEAFRLVYMFFHLRAHQNPILYGHKVTKASGVHRINSESLQSLISNLSITNIKKRRSFYYAGETAMYMLLNVLGYIIMLIVMTFNGWFALAVLFGTTLGYFVFGNAVSQLMVNSPQIAAEDNAFRRSTISSATMETNELVT